MPKINNIFDVSKLNLYLKNTARGFVLLTVNEKHFQDDLVKIISSSKKTAVYNLEEFNVQSIKLNDLKEELFIYKCLNSDDISVLGKVNLSRDILLKEEKLFVFIVPKYVSECIQKEYPDLYSYFILKDSYLIKYENFFDYILPNKAYLRTKTLQKISKENYHIDKGQDLNETLDYFLYAKADKKEIEDLKKYISDLIRNMDLKEDYNFIYYNRVLLKCADVLLVQGEYKNSLYLFHDISRLLKKNTKMYYDALIGMGDSYFYLGCYEQAQAIYEQIILTISDCNSITDIERQEYFDKIIYLRIVLCYIKIENYEGVSPFIKSAVFTPLESQIKRSSDSFEVYYNFFVFMLSFDSNDFYIMNKLLDIMKNVLKDYIQEAMYLTIKAWYDGVIQGNLKLAFENSNTALSIKRERFIENDIRIAESHYTNSVLYYLNGDYQKADKCCDKCIHILKNFPPKSNLSVLAVKLKYNINMEC